MSTTLLDQQQGKDLHDNPDFGSVPFQPVYIDVRTTQEFEAVHIAGARNIPLPDLHQFLDELKALSLKHPILLVCRTKNRVKIAYECLINNGVTNCSILEGGITAWEAEGKPVIKGKQSLSLEGQTRAIAGGLILLGVIFGFTVHNAFFLLPALVGAGLLHAGLTDSCLMGMVLSKLPMNRISKSRSSQKKGET